MVTQLEALAILEDMGTEQNRKVYTRHGVDREQFGVSHANLGKLKKSIKIDHALALDLWQTGNHDAMVLATMIADPSAVKSKTLDDWSKDLDNYLIADSFSKLVAKSNFAEKKLERWTQSKKEFVGQTGWNVLASVAMGDKSLPDSYFEPYLNQIETDIHDQKNRIKHSMNQALIAIGVRGSALEKKALKIAKTIGKVEVDHGQTGCKTPDATGYIKRTLDRKGHVLAA